MEWYTYVYYRGNNMNEILWEYIIYKEGDGELDPPDFSWETTVIGLGSTNKLNGFAFQMRPYTEDINGVITYLQWKINSQTIVSSIKDSGVKTYTSTINKLYLSYCDKGGIVDDTGYIYPKVFDQSRFFYLPALSGGTKETFKGEVEATSGFPTEPYDPKKDIYPIDTVTKFSPDEREEVTVSYKITTKYIVSGITLGPQGGVLPGLPIQPSPELTHEMTIYQVVKQPSNNWGDQLKGLLARSYFSNGIYH
jgi:hypothetical protein